MMERVRIGKRWFGIRGRRPAIRPTADPTAMRVNDSQARAASGTLEIAGTLNLRLTELELKTVVLALKFGRMRYGMLLQLAEQRGEAVLSWEAIGDLKASLDCLLRRRAGA